MKIGLYSPYIPDHFGGGEKHFFDIALTLAAKHAVIVALPPGKMQNLATIIKAYESFLGQSLAKLQWQESPVYTGNLLSKLIWTAQFDYLYSFTDGSFFFSLARRSNLHFQVPLKRPPLSLLERFKLASWQTKNANSLFTKQFLEKRLRITIPVVHYPLVDASVSQPAQKQRKQKIILSVGRFFRQLHSKRQDIAIECFKTLRERQPEITREWRLVLVGTVEDEHYFDELKKQAADLPVSFAPNCTRSELESWYQKATFYWHAAGYGVNETEDPDLVEHFGISTVEAMAHGVVPLVVYKGGQKEILSGELAQLGWQTVDECITKTAELMGDHDLQHKLAASCVQRSVAFGNQAFEAGLFAMVERKL